MAKAPLEWFFTTRPGAEPDLVDELALLGRAAKVVQPGVVTTVLSGPMAPTFARQGFPILARVPIVEGAVRLADVLAPALRGPSALHVFCPDTDTDNRNQRLAQGLFEELSRRLKEADVALLDDSQAARDAGGFLAQVCLLSEREALLGVMRAGDAISLAPGGRMRSHVSGEAPARSAMKLAEAFTWFGQGPEPGDVCVDLGAAPGGWTHVLSQRRAHVVAIDPGALRPQVLRHGVEHLRMSAFDFEPEVPADWLFCDMAWRPLEVAALLAKWGRRHWARFLIANIKLPMNKRAAMVQRVLEILRTGGWTALKARQLYHDRDEVTIAGWRGFGGDARPPAKKREPMPATKPKTGGERGGRPQGSGGGPRRQNYGKGRR